MLRRTALSLVVLAPVLATLACGADADARARHLVLVTIDTHRGDHVLGERAGRRLTPFLDELAGRSLVFREAMSVSDATTPGTAGILTGLLPHRSGVIANSNVVGDELPHLADLLRRRGFRTAGFVSNPNLRAGTGFERGFDVYERIRGSAGGEGRRVKARAHTVTEAALAWLAGVDGASERVFLWVHYMEPHGPYEPPAELRELFPSEAFGEPRELPLLEDNSGRGGIPGYQHVVLDGAAARDAREYLARYAAEVRAIDEGLRELFDGLAEAGLLAEAACVVTADHGEALAGERGFFFSHANGAARDQVHVPLMVTWPEAQPAVVDTPVSTVDIAPSVLELLGLPRPSELDGRSLLAGGSPYAVSFTQSEAAVRGPRFRLIARPDGKPRLLVDDLADPASAVDLRQRQPEELRALVEVLDEVRARPALARPVDR